MKNVSTNYLFKFLTVILVLGASRFNAQTTFTFNYTGSLQTLTIPPCVTTVTIEARGGQGGTATIANIPGGRGAIMKGVFNVTGGSVLNIMVGAKGNDESYTSGGGGGSGVAIGSTPLIIAGGGGGINNNDPGYSGIHAVATNSGVDGNNNPFTGGTSGNDGSNIIYVANGNNIAYGGRGWNSGFTGSTGQNGSTVNTVFTNGVWGLGGGGGSVGSGYCNCGGGGGGYSGGGAGGINNSGGGGGSYNAGTNQVNIAGPSGNQGNGMVIISYNNVVPASNAIASPSVICYGASTTLSSTAAGSYTWSNGSNSQTTVVSPTVSTVYTVSSTASVTCVYMSTVGVIVKPNPTVTLSSSSTSVCLGNTVSVTSAGHGSVINWYTTPTGGSPVGTSLVGGAMTFTPAATTTYYAEVVTGPASGSQSFNYTGAIVSYTVPNHVTAMTIETRGAQGGGGGGLGAYMRGSFSVTPGQVLKVLAGGAGSAVATERASGGGGSFVSDNLNNPLIVAGGGGGRAQSVVMVAPGIDANITQNGNNGYSANAIPSYPGWEGIGGVNGNGATSNGVGLPHAGNGGGFYTNGANGICSTPGLAFVNGGTGGMDCFSDGVLGGFGGGGGSGNLGGGGGGGYSGGGGSYHGPTNGGGGGSYNIGYGQQNTAGAQTGNGQVVMTWNVAGGCVSVSRTPVTITVAPLPTVGASVSNASICIGGTTSLIGSGANTYTWSGGVPNNTPFSPTVTTSYTLAGTNAAGCTSTNNPVRTVVVNPLPTVVANATSTFICINTPITLSGSGASTYTWTSGAINGTPFTPTVTTTYTVMGTDNNNCINTAQITVTVNPLPNVTASINNSVICMNDNVILNGGGANTYTWYPTAPNGSAFAPTGSTTYTVVGTSLAGCTSTNLATVSVSVNPLPIVSVSTTSAVICFGGTTSVNGSGANTYTWTGGVTDGVPFSPTVTTSYFLSGTDLAGCTSTNNPSQLITVNPLPNVTANPSSPAICINETVSVSGGGASTYTWASGISNGVAFSPTLTNTYSVSGTDGNGCINSATVSVVVNPLPNVTASINNSVICMNDNVILNGGGANNYTWYPTAPNGSAFAPTGSTTYTVVGTSLAGCTSTNLATVSVLVNPLPIVSVSTTSAVICFGGTTSVNGSGANTYTWTGGVTDGVPFTPTVTTTYFLSGTDLAGCTSTNNPSQVITVNPLPVVTAGASTVAICENGTLTLNGGNANTYTWTPFVVDGSVISPTVTTTYTVNGTSLAGCTSTNNAVITITVHPLPNVSASISNSVICAGETTTLNGSGALSYTWSPTAPDGVGFVPTASTTYTLAGTSTAGCTSTNEPVVSVTVNALPTVTAASSNSAICIGGTVSLNGGGATTYTWSGTVVDNVAFSPTTTATYSVVGTDNNSCENTATITVIVHSLPIVTANASSSVVCDGDMVTLNGSGANTYTWTGNVSDGVAFTPTATTSYTVTGTATTGCTSTNVAVQTISVIPLPVVTVSASDPVICFGGTTAVSASGASTYVWTGGISDGVPFSPTVTTSYSVTGTASTGCTSTNVAVQTITVHPLPNVTASSSSSAICIGGTVSLTGGGATTYTWSGTVLDNTPFTPTATATYTVHGTDNNTCENSATITVVVDPVPTTTALATKIVICFGDTTTLSGAGASTYSWSGGAPNGVPFSPTTTTSYTLTGFNSAGCTNTNVSVVTITVNPLPTLTITYEAPVICVGYSTNLTGSGAATYTWSHGLPNGASFSPTATAEYTLTATDANTCENFAVQTITVNNLPVLSVNSTNGVSCEAETVTLRANGASSYTWSTFETGQIISVSPTVTSSYSITGIDDNGCVNSYTFVQTVTVCPEVLSAEVEVRDVSCKGRKNGRITVNAVIPYTNKEVTYVWSVPSTCASNTCNVLDSLNAGTYSVLVKVSYTLNNILAKTDSILVTDVVVRDDNPPCELQIYTGLTLNNDGINEKWIIENIELFPKNNVMIFSRWGNKVAEINGYNNLDKVWPSPEEADKLPESTYFYIIDLGDGTPQSKGWLEVMK